MRYGNTVSCLLLVGMVGIATGRAQSAKKETQEYYKKWLEADITYIISEEERSVFQKLSSDAEREQFIEQFWRRRDPAPETMANEYREEHYRRLSFANAHYSSGIPGWKTDRGKIYIKFGPPNQIEAYPSGGHYNRPSYEGGGSTSTYPFEIWRYRNLTGVGQDIEIEFVDQTLSGEYAIADNPWTKDALLHVPGAGSTEAEVLGLASRADRIVPKTNPMPDHNPLYLSHGRLKDQPFEKLQLLSNLQRAPKFTNPELRALVHAEVKYQKLPFDVRSDYLRVSGQKCLVPVTLKVLNRNMQYEGFGGVHRSVLNIYGEVASLSGGIVTTFEETVSSDVPEEQLRNELKSFSLYQKALELPPGRYKLNLVVKDENSTNMGAMESLLVVPRISEENLSLSSVVTALRIEASAPGDSGLFHMGPARVFPDPRAEAKAGGELPVFFQIYNLAAESTSGAPLADVQYVISQPGKPPVKQRDELRGLTGSTLSVVRYLPLETLSPGACMLEVTVWDVIRKTSVGGSIPFTIIP